MTNQEKELCSLLSDLQKDLYAGFYSKVAKAIVEKYPQILAKTVARGIRRTIEPEFLAYYGKEEGDKCVEIYIREVGES